MTRREKFTALLVQKGYKSVNNFCDIKGFQQGNLNRRVKHEDLKVDITTIFEIANALNEPIDVLLEIFYPAEMQENKQCCKK